MTDLSKQSSEGLTGVDPSDDDVADIEKRVRGAYAQELEDAIRYRRRFFWWGVGITSVCVSASIGMIVFLVLQDVYETPRGRGVHRRTRRRGGWRGCRDSQIPVSRWRGDFK